MCDAGNMLKELQAKKKKLHCKPGTSCWCAQLIYKLDIPTSTEQCMTPEQIYDIGKDEMCEGDKQYLQTLFGRRLVED